MTKTTAKLMHLSAISLQKKVYQK